MKTYYSGNISKYGNFLGQNDTLSCRKWGAGAPGNHLSAKKVFYDLNSLKIKLKHKMIKPTIFLQNCDK